MFDPVKLYGRIERILGLEAAIVERGLEAEAEIREHNHLVHNTSKIFTYEQARRYGEEVVDNYMQDDNFLDRISGHVTSDVYDILKQELDNIGDEAEIPSLGKEEFYSLNDVIDYGQQLKAWIEDNGKKTRRARIDHLRVEFGLEFANFVSSLI